ncbi:helix-turn-helix domain-containing protein [Fusibacter bizertensis]
MISTYDMDKFSNEMKKMRISLGFTIENVSEFSGISRSAIKSIEKGQSIPKFETLQILSSFYKRDLLLLFNTCKNSTHILNFYDRLNEYMSFGNMASLKETLLEVKECLESKDLKPIDYNDLHQLKLFFQALDMATECSTKTPALIENAIELLCDALKVTNQNFSVDNFHHFKYHAIEYNILFSLASLLGLKRECNLSNQILIHICEYIADLNSKDYYQKILTVKSISVLSYNFHRMDNHKLALEYAEKGIVFCLENDTSIDLPLLLARKSIALHYLNTKNWEVYYLQALSLLEIQNRHEMKVIYENTYSSLLASNSK